MLPLYWCRKIINYYSNTKILCVEDLTSLHVLPIRSHYTVTKFSGNQINDSSFKYPHFVLILSTKQSKLSYPEVLRISCTKFSTQQVQLFFLKRKLKTNDTKKNVLNLSLSEFPFLCLNDHYATTNFLV